MSLKDELQNLISGNGSARHGKAIRAITDFLRRKKEAISGIEEAHFVKAQEAQELITFKSFTRS